MSRLPGRSTGFGFTWHTVHRYARAPLMYCAMIAFATGCSDGAEAPAAPPLPDDHVSSIVILKAPEFGSFGQPFLSKPLVQLRGPTGKPARVAGVTVTVSISEGTLAGTTLVKTDVEGNAWFTDLVADGSGTEAEVELRFDSPGVATVKSVLRLSLADVSIERIDPYVISGFAGQTLSPGPRVLLKDERLNPRVGAEVEFSYVAGRKVLRIHVTTDSAGIAVLPSFQFPDLPSTTDIAVTDGIVEFPVHYSLWGRVRGKAYADSTIVPVAVGTSEALPRVRVILGQPVAGALVRYRIASGSGLLSTTEVHTGADGWTEPVSLGADERGTTVVEMIAVGYSESPMAVSIPVVIPPLTLEYGGACTPGCPSSFTFEWPVTGVGPFGMFVPFHWRVRDAIGAVADYQLALTKGPIAGNFWVAYAEDYWMRVPDQMRLTTDVFGDAFVYWELPSLSGSYSASVGGPMIETPWTYTATVK